MGRKLQKTNRHKKIKSVDPFYNGERKLLLDKGLILANKEPVKDDNQICSKLREITRISQELIIKKKNSKTKTDTVSNSLYLKPDSKGAEVPLRATSNMIKNTDESDTSYLNRIDREIDTVIQRSQYEEQFDVKLETKDDKVLVKKEKKMRVGKKRTLEKLKNKVKLKKLEKSVGKKEENDFKQDHVEFGEVVHNPPVITSFPKIRNKNVGLKPEFNQKKQISEKDRMDVVARYRLLKSQGKFN